MFAFGITLYEMFSSELPYPNRPLEQIMYLVGRGLLLPDFSQCRSMTPTLAIEAMKQVRRTFCCLRSAHPFLVEPQCVTKTPSDRPPFSTLAGRMDELARKTPVLKRSGSDTVIRLRKPGGGSQLSIGGDNTWTPRPLSIRRNMTAATLAGHNVQKNKEE